MAKDNIRQILINGSHCCQYANVIPTELVPQVCQVNIAWGYTVWLKSLNRRNIAYFEQRVCCNIVVINMYILCLLLD